MRCCLAHLTCEHGPREHAPASLRPVGWSSGLNRGSFPCLEACWRRQTDPVRSDTTADLAEKVGTAMYETDPGDGFEAAPRLSEDDPVRGAEALDRNVASNEYDPDERFEAALRLSEVDPARAVARLRSIAARDEFDRDIRDEAAHRLSELEQARG
jgi:hypothetical protein